MAARSLTLVFLSWWTCVATADTSWFPPSIDTLKHEIDSVMHLFPIPGAAVALVSRDSIIWLGTFGYANLETGEPVTENTHFCLGSCTKSIVGLGFLRLLDEGKIDLNTPVREIAPEIKIDNPWHDNYPVRVVHLLEHTAGFDDSHPNWFYFEGPVLSLQRALQAKAHVRRVRWPPGTRFAYSSAGYTLAGYVLEKVTGQLYSDYLQQTLLQPVGMTTATIGSSEECRRYLAVGYNKDNQPFPLWYDYDEPAGALNASIREMALFIRFLLNRGAVGEQQIISAGKFDLVAKPTTTLAAQAGLTSGYSFGIGTRQRGGAKWYGHSGAVPGFLSEYGYNLDHGLGYVVLQNSFDVMFYDDVFTLVRRYAESRVDSGIPPPVAAIPAGLLESYCGYYEPRSPRMQLAAFAEILVGGITVLYERDTLFSQSFMEASDPLIPVSQTLFRRVGQPEASGVFIRTSEGRMAFATQGSYYEKASPWKPLVYRTLVFGAFLLMLSAIVYALVWVPLYAYRRLKGLDTGYPYLAMRVVPLLAVISLLAAIATVVIAQQTILQLGQKTPVNVAFAVLTWIFAGLSILSLYTSYRSFSKPVRPIARIYAVIVSFACFGMTLYLGYWGLIGLRLWAY